MSKPVLMIQEIRTSWTKRSRGGSGAVLRNRVPERYIVPSRPGDVQQVRLLHHKVLVSPYRDFKSPEEKVFHHTAIEDPLLVGCVKIVLDVDHVSLRFAYSMACGAPDRGWIRKTITAPRGGWAQMIYNGRFSQSEAGWRYEKVVVNVGVFAAVCSNAFMSDPPASSFRAVGHLL